MPVPGIGGQLLLKKHPSGDGGARSGAWQTQEAKVRLLAVLVTDVEAGEAHGGAAHVERADRPDQARYRRQQIVGMHGFENLKRQECRRDAEADDVSEAVELAAEVGGMARVAGKATVDGIENHREEDQVGGGDEIMADEVV